MRRTATAAGGRALAAPGVGEAWRVAAALPGPRWEESNKNFFLDGALCWPITPTLRQQPVMFHVEPLEDSVVWALSFPADTGAPPPSAS